MTDSGNLEFKKGSTVLEDLGIGGFLRLMVSRRWLLGVIPTVWILSANLIFLLLKPEYAAVLELTAPSAISSRTGGSASGLGGGAGLLGSVLGAGSSSDPVFSAYLESWNSSWFAERVAGDQALMHQLFASQWTAKGWSEPTGVVHAASLLAKRSLGITSRPWHPPSADEVQAYFQSHVTIETSRVNVIARVSLRADSPELAGILLSSGHRIISRTLSDIFRKSTQQHVDYLLQQLVRVQVTDYREALLRELETQEKILMLTSDSEFATQPLGLHVLDAPVAPATGSVLLEGLLISLGVYALLVIFAEKLRLPLAVRPFLLSKVRWGRADLVRPPRTK